MCVPIREGQALQNFTLAGDRAELAALVHGGHAEAAVALHAAPHQQPVPWLKNVQLHLLTCTPSHAAETMPFPLVMARWRKKCSSVFIILV